MCAEELALLIVEGFKHPELRVEITDSWIGAAFSLHPPELAASSRVRRQSCLAPVCVRTR